MRKLTREEFVEKALSRAKRPVDLSQFEYGGSAAKSTAICPTHGPFQISANALMNRIGCAKCFDDSRGDTTRLTTEGFIIKARNTHGDRYDYSLVKYVTSQKKVKILCAVHGEFEQGANSHLGGRGCPKCRNDATGDKWRMSNDEFLARCRETHGDRYDLSKVSYSSMAKKVEIVCPTHGSFFPVAGNFTGLGSGCPGCGREAVGLKSRKPLEYYVARAREKHGDKFSYLGLIYKGPIAFLLIDCPEHGKFEQVAQDHIKGIGCTKCSSPLYDQDSFLSLAKALHKGRYSYENATYYRALEKVQITCPTHGAFWQTPSSHISGGQGCPRCAGVGPSTGQIEIADFLREHAEVALEKRLLPSTRRLDIFLPEHNLAVEFHGLIWHSTKFAKDPKKDYTKHKVAELAGIRVIHIYQDEWEYRQEIVKRTLLSAVGSLQKIGARLTEVRSVDKLEANTFFEENHLQGAPKSSVFLGLYLENRLVSCMAFNVSRSIRRNTDSGLWELQRYASTCTVVGGAGRLLAKFKSLDLCHTLVSYSDTRLFSGAMYQRLGFSLEHETGPDYCYVSWSLTDGRIHKAKFQRSHLAKRLENFDPSKSEVQNCFDHGWYQLFDCGKKKWVLKL